MSVAKHKLTTKSDKITGGTGSDLFIGALNNGVATLNSSDVLQGGAGTDTLSASLSGTQLKPTLVSIEKGIFTHLGQSAVGLDLLHAGGMHDVTMKNFHSDAKISHAAHVDAITIRHMVDHTLTFTGIDAAATKVEKLAVFDSNENNTFPVLVLNSLKGVDFKTLDVSLTNSEIVVEGTAAASNIHIHSLGKHANDFSYFADTKQPHVKTVTVDGGSDIAVHQRETLAFSGLTSFNASKASGAVTTGFVSDKLISAKGGSGDDVFEFAAIGGTVAKKAVVNMGAGNDQVTFDLDVFQHGLMQVNGGKGNDRAVISGSNLDLTDFKSFETLSLVKASGNYQLGAGWRSVVLLNEADNGSTTSLLGGTSLHRVQGSDFMDVIAINHLSGSAANKAHVSMGAGSDSLDISTMTLNAATQSYDGGDGTDHVYFTGALSKITDVFHDFERFHIFGATGQYDFTGSGVDNITLGSAAAGATVFNELSSIMALVAQADQTKQITLNLHNAVSNTSDSVNMVLAGASVFGSGFGGFTAAGLSNLIIGNSDTDPAKFYLTAVGSAGDAAKIEMVGAGAIKLAASIGSSSYIKEIDVSGTGGLDMLGINDGLKALVSSGVVINGGAGADSLVGGDGADHISTGGGSNMVVGSLGADEVVLATATNLDLLVFNDQAESSYGVGHDVVSHFGALDFIDLTSMGVAVTFAGDVANQSAGLSALSAAHASAFFNTADNTLYIDLNHDKQFSAGVDMEIELSGTSVFNGSQLLS